MKNGTKHAISFVLFIRDSNYEEPKEKKCEPKF